MNALLFVLILQSDSAELERIAVQHGDRIKPLDTFARELLHAWSGSETFSSFRDPETGETVEVFAGGDPVSAILDILWRPDASARKFVRIQHPELKLRLGLPEARQFFSLDEIDARLADLAMMHRQSAGRTSRDQGPLDRAVLALASAYEEIGMLRSGNLLRIVPVEYGPRRAWVYPELLRRTLHPAEMIGLRQGEGGAETEEWAAAAEALSRIPREKLREVLDAYDDLKKGGTASARLANALREVDPAKLPSAKLLDSEVRYNRAKPFTRAAALYGLTFVLFLFAAIFGSRILWSAGLVAQVAALGVHLHAYAWRWEIAQRFPLSNQYEAMLALAFLGALMAFVFECVLRSKLVGMGAGLVGASMILLADAVSDFSPHIRALPPALQSVWMTIHVPTILMGYVCGALMAVLGHVYILTFLFAPKKEETLATLDTTMYRILQVTVLFLLAGTVLGGVWAKEAWGRFWGWDMKETWALISLLAYLAALHARFAGAIRGLGTAVSSLLGIVLVFLTFYGVNYVFGRGLHAYGFGAGSVRAVVAFVVVEIGIAAAAVIVSLGRSRTPAPQA
ncbi:MAG: cytochrome c biogenesis protein CcsA [Planctomycetes bacterium]|nr:cytochrome c biogenesis protein CcsA [Planctomycetota bacterium]